MLYIYLMVMIATASVLQAAEAPVENQATKRTANDQQFDSKKELELYCHHRYLYSDNQAAAKDYSGVPECFPLDNKDLLHLKYRVLVAACTYNDINIVKAALASNVSPNKYEDDTREYSMTPLIAAVAGEHAEVIKLLLEHKADQDAKADKDDLAGKSARDLAWRHPTISSLLLPSAKETLSKKAEH